MDTVHHDQEEMVRKRVFKEIVWNGDDVTAINPLLPKETKISSNSHELGRYAEFFGGNRDEDDITDVIQNDDGTFSIADDNGSDKKSGKKPKEKQEEKPVEMGR